MPTPGLVGVDGSTSSSAGVLVGPDGAILRATYDELYGLYRRLYPATRDVVHDLAGLVTTDPTALEGAPA